MASSFSGLSRLNKSCPVLFSKRTMPVVQIYRRFILLEHLQIIPLDLIPFHCLAR